MLPPDDVSEHESFVLQISLEPNHLEIWRFPQSCSVCEGLISDRASLIKVLPSGDAGEQETMQKMCQIYELNKNTNCVPLKQVFVIFTDIFSRSNHCATSSSPKASVIVWKTLGAYSHPHHITRGELSRSACADWLRSNSLVLRHTQDLTPRLHRIQSRIITHVSPEQRQ